MNSKLTDHLDQPLVDVAVHIDAADIYDYARQYLRMHRFSADAYADWLDADLADWGPDGATLRDVLNAAHQVWTHATNA